MLKVNMQPKLHFRNYLIMLFSSIILLIVLATGLISLSQFTNIMEDKTRNYSMDISSQIENGLTAVLNDLNRRTDRIVRNSFIQDVAVNKEELTDEDREKCLQILKESFDQVSLQSIYLKSADLYFISSSERITSGDLKVELDSSSISSYYKRAMEQPTVLCWAGYDTNTQTINAVRLIYDLQTYEVKGMLLMHIDEKYMFDTYMDYKLLETSDMFIINSNNQILSSKDINNIGKYFKKDYTKQMNLRSGFLDTNGEFLMYHSLRNLDWKVISVVNKNMIFRDIYLIRNRIYIYLVVFIFLGVLVSMLVSTVITEPIKKLVGAMKEAQTGNFDVKIRPEGSNEMSFLMQSFNNMVEQINSLINNIYKERLVRKEIEIKALQGQMNPHFLFNTLEIINFKAREYNAQEVCDMIQNLSYLLSVNIGKDEKMITLHEELTYINNYFSIVKKKYGDRITFDINIEEGIMNCLLPKLLLQPFVENSINHGLSGKIGTGNISISGRKSSDMLLFEIVDNGIGMTEDKLNNLLMLIRKDNDQPSDITECIAIRNTYKRIKLMFGDDCDFSIESQLYGGTKVTICIPAKDIGEGHKLDVAGGGSYV